MLWLCSYSVPISNAKVRFRIIELICITQGMDVDRKLASFEARVKGENADDKDSYLTDLESLACSTKTKVQQLTGTSHTSDGEL